MSLYFERVINRSPGEPAIEALVFDNWDAARTYMENLFFKDPNAVRFIEITDKGETKTISILGKRNNIISQLKEVTE